jgi:hypothetical protein
MTFLGLVAVTLAAATLATPARAQEKKQEKEKLCDRPVNMSRKASQFPMVGLRFGSPLRVSAYNGWWWPTGRNTMCKMHLWVATAEAGVGGAQANWGFQHGQGDYGSYLPMREQVSLLRTWGNPMQAIPNQTYVGFEAQAQMVLGLRGSFFWPIGSKGRSFLGLSLVVGF